MITPALRFEPVAITAGHTMAEDIRITGEICARLEELEELKCMRAWDLITRLSCIAHTSPKLFRVVIALLRGRTDVVADSYNVQGSKRGLSKQAVHTEFKVHMRLLHAQFPHVAKVIEQIQASATAHEDQQSHADALRQSMKITHEF